MSSDEAKFILEHFDDKFAVLLENIEEVIEIKVRPIVQEELVEVKKDIALIKDAVKGTNHDVAGLQRRVAVLEKARA